MSICAVNANYLFGMVRSGCSLSSGRSSVRTYWAHRGYLGRAAHSTSSCNLSRRPAGELAYRRHGQGRRQLAACVKFNSRGRRRLVSNQCWKRILEKHSGRGAHGRQTPGNSPPWIKWTNAAVDGGAGWLRVAPVSRCGRRVEASRFGCERPRRQGVWWGYWIVQKPGASYYWIG